MTKTIRFYGLPESLKDWRKLLMDTCGREPSAIKSKNTCGLERHYFDVQMTDGDRQSMMVHWYADSGTGTNAQGINFRWNECISFEVRKCS